MNTEIIILTDSSGSMASIKSDAEGGVNNFIREQKAIEGEARVTNVLFNTITQTLYKGTPIDQVHENFAIAPCGGTALLDAIGSTLEEQAKRIHDEKWADIVIFVIVTDGEENASRKYEQSQIKQMIEHAQGNGWTFIFLAANQDAFKVGGSFGIQASNRHNFSADSQGTLRAYATISASTTSLRTQQP